ncbi:MAG: hypothetical protein ACNA7O_17470 [Rhodobacterales bacterium]
MKSLIDQLAALRLHGMAACAQDMLAARTPPSLTPALKTLIKAETEERRLRSIQYQMRIAFAISLEPCMDGSRRARAFRLMLV